VTDCNHDGVPTETLREHMIRAHGCTEAMVRWVLFMRGYALGIAVCHEDTRNGGMLKPGDLAIIIDAAGATMGRGFLLGFTDGYRFEPLGGP
jgi:hypothetical protein